jgi:threonine/homoserine/homoserine lactone efflux protein
MFSFLVLFFLITLIAFATGIPFGPVNLSVVNASLNHNSRAGIFMSAGSATAEALMMGIAIYLTSFISVDQTQGPWIKVTAMLVFIAIGLIFYYKGRKPQKEEEEQKNQPKKTVQFFSGFAVSIFNPQIIPFWVIVIAWLNGAGYADIHADNPYWMLLLLTGAVFLGKGGVLVLYSLFCQVIKERAHFLRPYVNRGIGILLVCLGFFQGARAAWEYFL